MNPVFLHELPDFKELIRLTTTAESISDPGLVEKDYWIMHVLWGLQQLNLSFHLKGGTSLSKGYGCINRFSEDIDLKIEPELLRSLSAHAVSKIKLRPGVSGAASCACTSKRVGKTVLVPISPPGYFFSLSRSSSPETM
jgi:hypothetical protein